MATEGLVKEFRGRVETVLDRQVEKATTAGLLRPWMTRQATSRDLTFMSFEENKNGERIWSISDNRTLQIADYSARLAILSSERESDTLFRVLEFPEFTPLQIRTVKEITELMPITDVLMWARSPLATKRELGRLARLTQDEIEELTPRVTDAVEASQRFIEYDWREAIIIPTPDWESIRLDDSILS